MNAFVCALYIDVNLYGHLFTVAEDETIARRSFINWICGEFSLNEKEIVDLENPPYPVPGKYAIMVFNHGLFVAGRVY